MKVTTLIICLLAFLFVFQAQTFAATYTVTTTTDPDDTQGSCAARGACTLRQAINTANAVAGNDTINFAAALSGQRILLLNTFAELTITSNITFNATAVTNVTVRGSGSTRVFFISQASAVVVMTGFTITGGNIFGDGNGGAIRNNGNLTLNNMIIQANYATTNSLGGGIFTAGAGNRLTINGGSILDNSAGNGGGGIYGVSDSVINLTNVTVSGNRTAFDGGGIETVGGTLNINGGFITSNTSDNQRGGGIYTTDTALTVTNASITNNRVFRGSTGGGIFMFGGSSTITNSTVSGNRAQTGGGIYFNGGTHNITGTTLNGNTASGAGGADGNFGGGMNNAGGTLNISNSTVSGNTSGCDCGGGGVTTYNNGITTLRNVTIANNSASAGRGGGITSAAGPFPPGTNNLGNTIVADNTAAVGDNKDVNGTIVSQGFNLVRTRGISTGYVASDLPNGSNPLLQALGSNGGTTQTQRLLAGSSAIDAGSNALAVNPFNRAVLTTDQRGAGFPRIVNGNGDSIATVDIGAFESPLVTTAATVSVSGRVVQRKAEASET